MIFVVKIVKKCPLFTSKMRFRIESIEKHLHLANLHQLCRSVGCRWYLGRATWKCVFTVFTIVILRIDGIVISTGIIIIISIRT